MSNNNAPALVPCKLDGRLLPTGSVKIDGIGLQQAMRLVGADHHVAHKHGSRCLTRRCVSIGSWFRGSLLIWEPLKPTDHVETLRTMILENQEAGKMTRRDSFNEIIEQMNATEYADLVAKSLGLEDINF
jgi:hypothetical protein